MAQVRAEMTRSARNLHSACLNLTSNMRTNETSSVVHLEKERSERVQLEQQLRDKVKELLDLQARFDADKTELNSR